MTTTPLLAGGAAANPNYGTQNEVCSSVDDLSNLRISKVARLAIKNSVRLRHCNEGGYPKITALGAPNTELLKLFSINISESLAKRKTYCFAFLLALPLTVLIIFLSLIELMFVRNVDTDNHIFTVLAKHFNVDNGDLLFTRYFTTIKNKLPFKEIKEWYHFEAEMEAKLDVEIQDPEYYFMINILFTDKKLREKGSSIFEELKKITGKGEETVFHIRGKEAANKVDLPFGVAFTRNAIYFRDVHSFAKGAFNIARKVIGIQTDGKNKEIKVSQLVELKTERKNYRDLSNWSRLDLNLHRAHVVTENLSKSHMKRIQTSILLPRVERSYRINRNKRVKIPKFSLLVPKRDMDVFEKLGVIQDSILESENPRETTILRKKYWLKILQMILAVKELHALGFVHNDIKESNFLVNGDDVELADVATIIPSGTKLPIRIGTDEYMPSKESDNSEFIYTKARDNYALGTVIDQLLKKQEIFDPYEKLSVLEKEGYKRFFAQLHADEESERPTASEIAQKFVELYIKLFGEDESIQSYFEEAEYTLARDSGEVSP